MALGRSALVLTVMSLTASCALVSGLATLDVGSTVDDGGAAEAATPSDGGARDAAMEAGACSCGLALPAGFTVLQYTKQQCPDDTKKETVYLDPQSVTASGACTCTCNMGGCSGASMTIYDSNNCLYQLGTTPLTGLCQSTPPNFNTASSLRVTGGTPTCTTSSNFPNAYSSTARLCNPDPSSCNTFCAPSNKDVSVCAVASGDVACPSGYPTKYVVGGSVTDTRTCAGCQCSIGNATCAANITFYGGATCLSSTADGGVSALVGNCAGLTGANSYLRASIQPSGTCTVQGGTASGSATPTNVRTVCCP
jgi:hypothetical protein